jgi:endonuclease/exonuclease/phosphatase family metal-dependent hydrolase
VLRRLVLACAAGLLAVPLAVAGGAAAAPGKRPPGKPVTMMTRNVYLGADINRPIQAALVAAAQPGANQLTIVTALANATHLTRAIVDDTDFGVRSGLLADEVVATRPDVIGLQEVALWRSGPLQLDQVGVTNAQHVDQDFLAMLLDALAARGAEYVPVSVAPRADVESPSFTGPVTSPGPGARDVRLTMRDVVLMRVDDGLRVTGEGQGVYDTNLSLDVAGLSFRFDRGYQWVDVRAGAQRFRVVNTHLEAFSSAIALAQAEELLDEAVADDRTTVLVCDCNSDPLNDTYDNNPTVKHNEPYLLLTGQGGFTDEWLEWAPAEQGWTSGLNETVDEPYPGSWTHRIDLVLARTADGDPLDVDRGAVTGREPDPRDPATGLWPSDHAGVVLRLRGL